MDLEVGGSIPPGGTITFNGLGPLVAVKALRSDNLVPIGSDAVTERMWISLSGVRWRQDCRVAVGTVVVRPLPAKVTMRQTDAFTIYLFLNLPKSPRRGQPKH